MTAVVETYAAELADLLEKKLGIRGDGLSAKIERAGRLLPRWVQRELTQVALAQQWSTHPKFRAMADPGAVKSAYTKSHAYLQNVDPSRRLVDRILSLLAVNAVNLGILVVLMVVAIRLLVPA